jgi:hypothetical protein
MAKTLIWGNSTHKFVLMTMDLFYNDINRGKRVVRQNLIGLITIFIIAEPIKFRVSSCNPRLTSF